MNASANSTRGRAMQTARLMRRGLVRFREVGPGDRMLILEAAACLALARLALIVLPFPRVARHLGDFVQPDDPRAMRAGLHDDAAPMVREIGWAVTVAARYMPFSAVCLPQAMAARGMLARRGIPSVMHFGAASPTQMPYDTHAWLSAAGVEVTGYPVAEQFVEIACFV